MPKTWIVELVAFSGAYQEQDRWSRHSKWVREATVHITRSDGSQEQYGCRPHQVDDDGDEWIEGRSLSDRQFARVQALYDRLVRRQDFACWARYDPPAWHNGNEPYRELRIVRVRLPDGRPVRASLRHLVHYHLPAGQRRKLERLLNAGSPDERLYRLYREAHDLLVTLTERPSASSRRRGRLLQQLQWRHQRRSNAFVDYIDSTLEPDHA